MNNTSPSMQLLNHIYPGPLAAQAISVVARLNIAELIDTDAKSIEYLTAETGAHPDALRRVMACLTAIGVFHETGDRRFEHTPASETLRREHPQSTRALAVMMGCPWTWKSWGELFDTVQTGEPGFERIYGRHFDQYMAEHPADGAIYNDAMTASSGMLVDAIVSTYDFSQFRRIVDVGGGQGALLEAILLANPKAKGVLIDLPSVVEAATALRSTEIADRCEVHAGNIFDAMPEGGDAYILKGILHGFVDKDAVKILQNCRQAIQGDGRLLVIESVRQEANDPNPQTAFMDLMMLTLVPGRERSKQELELLLTQAGFELTAVYATSGPSIAEAVPR